MKILVVDDEFIARIALQDMLQSYGTVHVAANGSEAIEAVRVGHETGTPYDVIFMDLLMPIMGGDQALVGIRRVEKVRGIGSASAVRIILVTALDAEGDTGRAGQKLLRDTKGLCDGRLTKPVRKATLTRLLRSLQLI
ncbi:MAG: response regulator [Kiritimatiellia bacterium]